jgi:hypothetical protein
MMPLPYGLIVDGKPCAPNKVPVERRGRAAGTGAKVAEE